MAVASGWGGVVLAGGRSSRMGRSKAALEWQGSTLLARTCAVLAEAGLAPVVVVTAPQQQVPPLPAGVEVVEDPVEGRGPLQGLATGLAALTGRCDAAFVCATDLPFLRPELVRRVLRLVADDPAVDLALPHAHGRPQPLAAAYRTSLAGLVAGLVDSGERRLGRVAEEVRTLVLHEADLLADPELAAADRRLDSLVDVDTPEAYEQARRCRLAP